MELVKPLDAPNNKGVSIYSEYSSCHGEKNPPLVAIKDDFHPSLLFLENALKSSNNFLILEEYAYNLLSKFSGKIDNTISKGSKFFRARIGYKKRGVIVSDNLWGSNYHYEPFKFSDIDAPPSIKATTGRMNREGVPYLYLSTDFETAIAEIRPHPGHYVSIGCFLSVQDLRIAKFYPLDIYDYSNNSNQLNDFLFLKNIDELFCTPIPPEQKHRYIMTQLLANILLKLGYDGISFRSSIHNGLNLTAFDATKFSYIEENNAVFKIEKLKYKFENIPLMISKNKYDLVKEW